MVLDPAFEDAKKLAHSPPPPPLFSLPLLYCTVPAIQKIPFTKEKVVVEKYRKLGGGKKGGGGVVWDKIGGDQDIFSFGPLVCPPTPHSGPDFVLLFPLLPPSVRLDSVFLDKCRLIHPHNIFFVQCTPHNFVLYFCHLGNLVELLFFGGEGKEWVKMEKN